MSQLQNRIDNIAAAAAAAAVEAILRQWSDEMDPPPPYNEAVNSATLSRTLDSSPASASTPPPQSYPLHPPRSPPHPNGASSRTTCPHAAHSTELTPREGSRTTRQREIRRQSIESMISDAFRESEETQSPDPRPPVGTPNPWPRSTGGFTQAAVGASRDDYYSDAALFRCRTMAEQQDLIGKMQRTIERMKRTIASQQDDTEFQQETIEILRRRVNDREKIIEEKVDCLINMSARLRETEALLQTERRRTRSRFFLW